MWNEDQEMPVLYFHGAPVGTKIEHMERDNRVAFLACRMKEIKDSGTGMQKHDDL